MPPATSSSVKNHGTNVTGVLGNNCVNSNFVFASFMILFVKKTNHIIIASLLFIKFNTDLFFRLCTFSMALVRLLAP